MATSDLEVFNKTIQAANIWLDEIMAEMGPDRQVAWHILCAVLRTIRDRLSAELAAHFAAQLPLIIRGAYYDQYRPETLPDRVRNVDAFLKLIGDELASTRPVNAKDAVRVVGAVISRHIDKGQVAKVGATLPEDVRRVIGF